MSVIGPVSVPYPREVRNAINSVMRRWVTFCQLPLEEKKKFIFLEDGKNGDAGYEFRQKEGEDPKETFMLTSAQMKRLWEQAAGQQNALEFLSRFDLLEQRLWPFLRAYVEQIGKEFLLEDGYRDGYIQNTLVNRHLWSYRFLHYLPDAKQSVLASPHPDRGGITAHLAESGPGLEWMDALGEWHPMEMNEGSTVIIPGMQFQLISKGQAKAVWHRVVANNDSKEYGRFALVVFIHTANTLVYDKKYAGRTQELPPGSTYTMPWDEFRQMFIK